MTAALRQYTRRMGRRAEKAATPVALAVAIILGGASRGAVLAAGALQLAGLAVLAWLVVDRRTTAPPAAARPVLAIAVALAAYAALQLLPLPWWLWTALPGRDAIADAFIAAGHAPAWAPLSLAPERTVNGLLRWIPPVAIFVLATTRSWRTLTVYLLWAVPMIAAASVALGFIQIYDGPQSELYVYEFIARGQPVGFFANINHQATLLLMTCPFLAALAGNIRRHWGMGDADYGQALAVATLSLIIVLGVLMAGSVAGYILLGPTLVLSFLVYRGGSKTAIDGGLFAGAGVALAVLAALTATSPVLTNLGVTDISSSDLSRPEIFARTTRAILDHAPLGSGLGSFEQLYPAYEDPNAATATFVNHAHNDYLEFVLEMGLPGLIGIVLALGWLGRETARVWRLRDGSDTRLKRAATVALGVVIAHSLVDYPLRTAGVAAFAALCLAIMVTPTQSSAPARPRTAGAPEEQRRGVSL